MHALPDVDTGTTHFESMSSTSADSAANGSGNSRASSSSSSLSSSSSSSSSQTTDDSTATGPSLPAVAATAAVASSDSTDSGPQPTPELMQQRSHVMADFAAAADERNRLIEKEQRRLRKEDRYVKVRRPVLPRWCCGHFKDLFCDDGSIFPCACF